MIEDEELGIKIAESPREKVIQEAIEMTEKRILHTEISLELDKNALNFLKTLK